jgi:hypothetical protein
MAIQLFLILSLSIAEVPSDPENSKAVPILNSFLHNSALQYYSPAKGFGLKALSDIQYGDIILTLPFQYTLTSFDYYPWSSVFEDAAFTFRLVPRLIYERFVNKDSGFVNENVKLYPKYMKTVYSYSEREKAKLFKLFGENMKFDFPIDCARGHEYYISKLSKIPNIDKCPLCRRPENFYWACQTVLTRAYALKKSTYLKLSIGKETNPQEDFMGGAIFPGIDMYNHMPMPKTKVKTLRTHGISFQENPAQVVVKADRDTKSGEEVFLSYGPKNNFELMLTHGFVLKDNSDDFFKIGIGSKENDCKQFDPEQKFCTFLIKQSEINYEALNYVLQKYGGEPNRIKDVEKLLRKDRDISSVKGVHKAVLVYRNAVDSFGLDRCKIGFREAKRGVGKELRSDIEELLDEFCLISHEFFFSHLRMIDRLLLKNLYQDLDII